MPLSYRLKAFKSPTTRDVFYPRLKYKPSMEKCFYTGDYPADFEFSYFKIRRDYKGRPQFGRFDEFKRPVGDVAAQDVSDKFGISVPEKHV